MQIITSYLTWIQKVLTDAIYRYTRCTPQLRPKPFSMRYEIVNFELIITYLSYYHECFNWGIAKTFPLNFDYFFQKTLDIRNSFF